MEEGDPIAPLTGEIDSNFAGLENERKKKLRNQILIWGVLSLAIIIIIAIIIILVLRQGGQKKGSDQSDQTDHSDESDESDLPSDVYGNIFCIYEIK